MFVLKHYIVTGCSNFFFGGPKIGAKRENEGEMLNFATTVKYR